MKSDIVKNTQFDFSKKNVFKQCANMSTFLYVSKKYVRMTRKGVDNEVKQNNLPPTFFGSTALQRAKKVVKLHSETKTCLQNVESLSVI